tara:strand:+ start:116 stop:946 length:831 start_codon:yes stop_codon:yes gene_type:complete
VCIVTIGEAHFLVTTPADNDQPQAETPSPEAIEPTQDSFLTDLSEDAEATPVSASTQAEPAGEGEGESPSPGSPAPESSPTENIPPVETTAAAPVTSTVLLSGETQQRQRIAQLEQENQQLQSLQAEAMVETQRAQYQQNLEQSGHGTDAAQAIADNWAQAQKSVVQYKQQIDGQAQETQAKVQAAQMIGTQHKVDPQALMVYNTPDAMQSAAKQMSENTSLRSRIEALEKKQVPAQSFDAGQSAGTATGRDALRDKYAEGGDLTDAELATLFENQ